MEDAAEEGADTMRVAPVCFGSAESRTKEKRVRSLPGRGGLWPGPGLSTTTDPRASVLSLSLSLLVEFLFLFSSFFPFTLTRRRIHTQGTAAARGPFLIASFQRSIDGELIYRAGALSSLRLESRGVIDAPRRRAKERERERGFWDFSARLVNLRFQVNVTLRRGGSESVACSRRRGRQEVLLGHCRGVDFYEDRYFLGNESRRTLIENRRIFKFLPTNV